MRLPRKVPKLQPIIPPEARAMVRRILDEEQPLNTHDIYERVHNKFVEVPGPPEHRPYWARQNQPQPEYPDHPIRSIRFLKHFVLTDMVERNEVRKILIRRKPLTNDEVGELERKIAKIERRNQRKLQQGCRPQDMCLLKSKCGKSPTSYVATLVAVVVASQSGINSSCH
ncbi:hypothetical protein BS47DRAFT_1484156 [Hydnum rufescens UP504]|uniref:Uncharacterized protein n=1 Tax=Hydnum rufescens UP504 TaxID=1448309 RepID=A0A9P6B468_9AGAM|nr:hypothetical protein BS47DRAFT_1484156 [Hydnum rufescens UP504]